MLKAFSTQTTMASEGFQTTRNCIFETFAGIQGGMATQQELLGAIPQTPPKLATLRKQDFSSQRPQTTKPRF